MNIKWQIAQAVEIKWWKKYLKNKPKKAYLQWKRSYWADLLKKINILFSDNDKILDAGCGPAGIFMVFGQDTDAVDPLLEKYETQLNHFKKTDYPNVRFYSQTLETFRPTQNYDKVFCLNAINHVADLNKCMDNLAAATKKNGYLILSIDAHNYTFLKKIFQYLPGDILHPHQYDLKEYKNMLLKRNFSIINTHLLKAEFIFNYYILVAQKL